MKRSVASFTLLIALATAALAVPTYKVVDLGSFGGEINVAYGLNAQGQVVGNSSTADGDQRAFLWTDGTIRDLGSFGGYRNTAFAINASGVATGITYSAKGVSHAFRSTADGLVDLGDLGGGFSSGQAINARGQVTGYSDTANGTTHAFRTIGDTMQDLGRLGTSSYAFGIDDAGEVVGNYDAGDSIRAFRTVGGVMQDLGGLGGDFSSANALNAKGDIVGYSTLAGADAPLLGHAFGFFGGWFLDLGHLGGGYSSAMSINGRRQVVGVSTNTEGEDRAFLYSDGSMMDLNSLLGDSGWTMLGANAINDSGSIVGYASFNGETRAVLLTPQAVPEPGTVAALGLGAFAVLRRRRR